MPPIEGKPMTINQDEFELVGTLIHDQEGPLSDLACFAISTSHLLGSMRYHGIPRDTVAYKAIKWQWSNLASGNVRGSDLDPETYAKIIRVSEENIRLMTRHANLKCELCDGAAPTTEALTEQALAKFRNWEDVFLDMMI